jgi:CRISPR-associated protein Cas8a1/Csx13
MEVLTKTANKITYRLNNAGNTIYHRSALGGLAATILSWDESPEGLQCRVENDTVEIGWHQGLSKKEAIRKLLGASFKLTDDLIIDLPGQGIDNDQIDLRVAIHNGLAQTFLQHPKSRPGEKSARQFVLSDPDDEQEHIFTYKPISRYAHQSAQGTGLFDDELSDEFPEFCTVPQSIVPGAFAGAGKLKAPHEEVILLLFLLVGSAVFQLRPRSQLTKAQHCVVVPNVVDLKRFAMALRRITKSKKNSPFKSNTLQGRVVGGAEEAALRFLLDFQIAGATQERSVNGCQAIVMGKVAWDANQINRSMAIAIETEHKEIDVFRAANDHLGNTRFVRTKKNQTFVVPISHLPELVAANLAHGKHWCAGFMALVSDKENFRKMYFHREGLIAMRTAIKEEDDIAIINAFHDAWRRTLRLLGERETSEHLEPFSLMERESEKVRNAILRTKTSDALASWFLRFCAHATEGGALRSMQANSESIRKFIFEQRNFERFQNLCLFALVSYEGKTKKIGSEEG